ncbi:hypothetical protein P153DRAFT_332464 [Dothidotthia symphoricarpi CBS 119687]|uniref:Carrier domain-containing protein n=1 Tax=Dothidotthia symphoricarpi CBS 119687 TaxID=1392245 RepID=A0A6A6ARI0_9PLEO|nr:uncharacterized protein P153DRAFT_332464 [Dothidotthia symphoricarpi CBS 119687]KAF2133554.1 hypothetical protein P153DRAFT_332464 [Dothidotthia symphoricarpi CBS 119687]
MVHDHEHQRELSILNIHPAILQGPTLLHNLVRTPSEAIAIDFLENGSKRRMMSYKTLHAMSDSLAMKITESLSRLENASAVIPVLLPQSPELYVALLAILKAGKAFCPLNLDIPEERLKFIMKDISANVIITNASYEAKASSATGARTFLVDSELPKRNGFHTLRLPSITTTDLAYVLYTSGSTGLPKAVSVSHRAVTQSLLAHHRHLPEFARFLQFAAPTFDVSIFEIFFPWYRGSTLVGCTRAQMLDDLPKTIRMLEVDAAELTPTVASNLLQGRSSVPGLKLLLTIGEMLTQHVVEEFGSTDIKNSILWGMYGPTEAAIHCTLQPKFSASSSIGIIGVPLDTVSALIIAPVNEGDVSGTITILPLGEVGELAVGGAQVAEGYLNRPELTTTSFVNHPKYGYLYRTGDRAKLRQDGTLECFGRIVGGQVKLRGQRVELGEIEHIIAKVDACRATAVMIIEDTLVAFCAVASRKVSRAEIIHTCQHWLPEHMVPSDVSFLSSMPQLPSGKVDKNALESQYLRTKHSTSTSTTLSGNGVDVTVVRTVQNHLKHAISPGSDLAVAGLNSLQSIRIASELRRNGYNLSGIDVLSANTVEDLVQTCIDKSFTNGYDRTQPPPIDVVLDAHTNLKERRADIAHVLPCTPLQEAMLVETMLRPSAYCNWIEVELSVSRTFHEIRAMVLTLAQANESLRTGFIPTSTSAGNFMQIVWKTLSTLQIQEVASFSKVYSLGSDESLLQPLAIQIISGLQKPRLLFQIHHALYDGWSFDLLLHDLDRLLLGLDTRRRPQFRDMVRYCVQDQGASHAIDNAYWAELLEGYIPSTLPNFNGKVVHKTRLQSLSGRSSVNPGILFERAHKLLVNPQVFFQVATAYVLGLYTGSSDVILGNVTSGRTVPVTEVEEMIGPCVASLPFRLQFDPLSRVQDVLVAAHSLNRAGMHHSSLPLREIAKTAHIQPGTRLFDALFVWQQSLSSDSNSSLNAKMVDSADDLEFKITLEFEPCKDSISFRATFDPSTIPEKQTKYMSQQIDDVVQLFLKDPDCTVANIGKCFTDTLRSIANPTPEQETFQNGPSYAVEKWARESPEKEAVVFGHIIDNMIKIKKTINYATLNSRANQLARLLIEHGVGKDQLVCIIMEKSIDLYISVLAVLKIRSGYLPLTPDTPAQRIKAVMDDAKAAVCISNSKDSQQFRNYISSAIIDLDTSDLSTYSDGNLDIPYNGSHLAYAIFTSGSTGTPKGVLVTQDNLMSNLKYLSNVYPYTSTSRLLQSCSQAFDVSVFEIFFSWYAGICLCTATKEDLFHNFEGSINRLGITHLSLTPTVASLINPKNVPRVEFLVTAGEALTEHVRREWAGNGLFQGYGPSETTNICTVRPSVGLLDLINNIGPPFDNTSAFVLDPDSETILPRGAVGELCFGGMQVFRGYLNRPDLNATRILNLPIYGRVYRSGDMGVLLPDDCILSTGRSDDQVKIRGQRVELGEITSTVLDLAIVKDCATLLLSTDNGTKRLAIFWVPTTASGDYFELLSPEIYRSGILEIFESLLHRLPSYMIPSHVVPISRLPMTAQAKIDKRLLQATFNALPQDYLTFAGQPNVLNSGPKEFCEWEKKVADLLAKILDLPSSDIERNSSFFNLGLDSVSAIRFNRELNNLGLGDFTVPLILKNPTIAHLASSKSRQSSSRQLSETPKVALDSVFNPDQVHQIRSQYEQRGLQVAKILPCTPLQEAMLSGRQSLSDSAYSNIMIFDIKGNVSRLQDSWALMIRRHEILRTSFIPTDDPSHAFAQVVLEESQLQWKQTDAQSDSFGYIYSALSDLLEAHMPPLWLALNKTEKTTKLLFCCHHALYDGVAISTLIEEIQHAYSGHDLPPPIPYGLYLEHMLSQNLSSADQFWATSLADFEPSVFPDLTGRALTSQHTSGSVIRRLQMPLSELRKACQSVSLSMLSGIQAAWAKLLHFYTGENDICFGNVVSGRTLSGNDFEHLVAPCFNTLPVRVNTTLKEGGRLFDTLVILQQPGTPLDDSIWTLEQDVGAMDLPVVCEILQDQAHDALELILHYHSTVLSEMDATIVAETFDDALTSLTRYPRASANDTIGFRAKLRAESDATLEHPSPQNSLLHSAFEQVASLQPDTIALDFLHADGERTTWSYKTLNEEANRMAHALLDEGILPEDIIPIHLPKSPQFYTSILGVLKAGAAFAPIHPDLPDERKRLMMMELGPKVVLCSDISSLPRDCQQAKMINVEDVRRCSISNPVIHSLSGSSLAYCLYTSGSTGLPKAVSMEHRAPVQTIESSRSLIPWTTDSRILQYAATTFDMCYYDCFVAWTFGIALCAAEQHEMLNELPKIINTLEVDLLDLTPSVAVSLSRAEVPKVKWLYCIGEALSLDITKEWAGACVNSYGPTEAAFCTTIYPVSDKSKASIIGKPFPTTSFAVFPLQGDRPLPLLGTGELYIGGAQLSRGYHGRSNLTEEKFVFKCGQRFYKSGDTVRMLTDGNFEFLGRADDQVKIRGQRVELGEINQVLQGSHSDIATVTTLIMRKNTNAKEQLVTFLSTRHTIDDAERAVIQTKMKQTAIQYLPSYMIPQFYIFVDCLPRSMAGKVDKKALAAIFSNYADDEPFPNGTEAYPSDYVWTELETQIRLVFAQLSRTPLNDITPTTTIYQLGLDSISAVQIAAAMRRQDHNASAADVMRYTNCVNLAAYLSQSTAPESLAPTQFDFNEFDTKHRALVLEECNLEDQDVEVVLPCTPLQDGIVSQFLTKDGTVYLNCLRLQLISEVDLDLLKEAWTTVKNRNRILRTGFAHIKDEHHSFAMVQHRPEAISLPWDSSPDDSSLKSTDDWLRRLQQRGLEKPHWPLWNIRIVYENEKTFLDLAIFHALFDAQSLQMILQEVMDVYNGQSLGEIVLLDPVLDAILCSSKDEQEYAEKFWTRLGRTASPSRFPNLTPLRCGPTTPAVLTKQSLKLLSDIEGGCRKANVSLQAVGIASWLTLLSAYTGQPTVTCGIVLAGRSFEAAAKAVFPCINTVPLTCTITEDRAKILETVMALNAEVQQHQLTPLNDIQRFMGYPNESLFDSIFAYQKLPSPEKEFKNDLWSVVDERATTEYALSLELEPKYGHLEYRLTYLPHIVPLEQASLILDQLNHLMECFVFDKGHSTTQTLPDQSIYSINPPKQMSLPSEATLLHELVELTAVEHPNRVALEFAHTIRHDEYLGRSWTYAELDGEGNRIAHILISHGVHPGDLVGVCFEKCPEASFAMLGILKAGGAFVAIDPGAPAARQTFVIEDSNARVVLSMKVQSVNFKESISVPVLNLDEVETSSLPQTKPVLERKLDPQDRSYCLYTSGTTGTPKGCELTHENAVQALLAFQRLFAGHWEVESRWLQFASFHFDVSVLEQYWSWSVGICVVSAPRDLIFEDLANSINTLGITHIDLTPSLAQILHPDDVPSLCKGVFITGGESLKQEILDVWGPKGVIYNGYGPTEATIGCTMYPRVPANGKPSNIGSQFDNVGSFVLQPDSDTPVLRGGVGELCVSGKLVGKGYLNRHDLTKERFPYLERLGERVYRTGDLVRILHDGTFDFLGRADDQVKLRGQRLEIGEINSTIRQSSQSISDVATLVLKHQKHHKEQLVAFVVLGVKSKSDSKALLSEASVIDRAKEACHERLPPYMVPTHFVPLASMPLNINNKADGKKLRDMYRSFSASDLQKLAAITGAHDEVWSKQEQQLHDVLKDILHVSEDNFGKDSSFFELGMDSISVIGVSKAMKKLGFSDATASLILRNPTIRRITKALFSTKPAANDYGSLIAAQQVIAAVEHKHRRTVAYSLAINPGDIEALAPCTPLQQGMIARYLDSDDGLYFNTFYFELSHVVNGGKLRAAWESVHDSTQILRTVFANTEDGYVQAVLRQAPLYWGMDSIIKNESIDGCLTRLRQSWLKRNRTELGRPFEVVFVATPNRNLLAVHLFHGLYDGTSINIMFDSVWNEYNGRTVGSDTPSFQMALAYGPLRILEGAKAFWQEHISDNRLNPFPKLVETPQDGSIVVTRVLDSLTTFEATRRRLNVTAQAIAQACWISVLEKYLKGTTIHVGLVVSGRSLDLEGAERIVGPMFNTIPYQHSSGRNESWSSVIKKLHDFNVAAHPYQHTPLRDIMKWCKRSPGQPLFDNLFVYQVAPDNYDCTNNEVWKLLDGDVAADYALSFEVEQIGLDELRLTLVTQGHTSNQETSTKLLNQFENVLRQVLTDPMAVEEFSTETNGIMNDCRTRQNHPLHGTNGTNDFDWTDVALTIRGEIAGLTSVEVDEISEATTIFELGLDSIDAIKLSSRLKKRDIDLPVSGIMRSLTIAKMVANISNNRTHPNRHSYDKEFKSHKIKLERYVRQHNTNIGDIGQVLPLTPLQEAMTAEMIASDFTRYYNYDIMELTHTVNVDKLRDAWEQVVRASPILRTSFVEVDDVNLDQSLAQIIHQQPHAFWTSTKVDEEPNFPVLFELSRMEAKKSSSFTPLFNVQLVEAPSHTYLLLSIAHALYDGWSLGLLHSDVHSAYHDQLTPRSDYVSTLAKILSTSDSDATTFWRDYLLGAKPSSIPRQPDLSESNVRQTHRHQQVSHIPLPDMQSFAKKNKISLQTLGQTVFAMVLASCVQSLDITFGCVLSGRDDVGESQLLFPMMNTVAIRTILHGTRAEMLQYVQENFNNIKQWQHYPLRKALSAARVPGKLFDGLFIYQKSTDEYEDPSKRLYHSVEGHSNVEYPVCVEMEVVQDELIWRCAASEEVFSGVEAKELASKLDEVLTHIIKCPEHLVIESTPQGVSVCGLPSFMSQVTGMSNGASSVNGENCDKTIQSQTARKIREVLAAVSKTPEGEITTDMTIFHVGLDSISAIKVSSLLRKQSIVLSVGDMLRAGTIGQMAQLVDARSAAPADGDNPTDLKIEGSLGDLDRVRNPHLVGFEETDVENILPVTGGQLYMLSMWLNSEGSNFYPTFKYRVDASATYETLQKSWTALVASNTILRTCFVSTKDSHLPYVQTILRVSDTTITNLTGFSDEEIQACTKQRASNQPWAHIFVSQVSTGWDLRLQIHHALYDGVSLPLLMQQFQDICNGFEAPSPTDTLGNLITKYSTAPELESRKSFWTKYLAGVEQHLFSQPSTQPTAKTQIFNPGLVHTSVLEAIARKHGISLQSLLLATYAKLYATLTGTHEGEDVVVGVYLANRSLAIENLVSAAIPTVNLLPLRIPSPLKTDILNVAVQIQRDLREISGSTNSLASLWEINAWTGMRVDTFVNFLALPDADQEAEGSSNEDRVTISQVGEWEQPVSRVSTIEYGTTEVPDELKDEQVNGVYLHAVDIEATVHNGALNVGVFAPVEMLDLEGGERLIQSIKEELEAVCRSTV